nr:MAG TPA: hypothetical protein [Caudoviricetes sp.]
MTSRALNTLLTLWALRSYFSLGSLRSLWTS